MKNLRKKSISSMLVFTILMAVFMPTIVNAEPIEIYDLWVGATQVTSANKDNVLGDGKVTFNPTNNTLSFENATITGKTKQGGYNSAVIFSSMNNLIIEGSLTINGGNADRGILTVDDCDLTIRADINSNKDINVEGNLVIESGTIILNGFSSLWSFKKVIIKSTVTKIDLYDNGNNDLNSGYIGAYDGITIEEPLAITKPSGDVSIGKTLDFYGILLNGGLAHQIIIEPVTTYNVKVAAINIDDYEELEGATLQVKDNTGKVIDEWVSTSASHEITGLNSNVEYTLEATVAPDGYIIPSKTTFTIASDGTITSTGSTSSDGVLLVEFEMTCVEIKCIKNSDSSLLSGVTIQILDENGNIVEEWSSSTVNHKVLGLITEKEYTLRVTSVPDEDLYNIPTDTTFTIDERGVITSTGSISGQTLLINVNETHIHNLTLVPAKDATCMAEGNNSYYTCSGCTKVFKDALGTVETTVEAETLDIDPNAHDWEDWIETTLATVDNEGVKTRICKNDSSHKETATIDRLPYAILEGDNQTFVIDSSKDISIKANGTFNKFLGLKMDGKDIESKFYTAVSGSTVVTLAQEYLNTLDEGEHILSFIYTDGTVDSTLKIAKASILEEISNNQSNTETTNTSSSPKTGDNIIMYIAMMIISTIGVFGTIKFIKKKN